MARLEENSAPRKIDFWPANRALAWAARNLDNSDPALRNVAEVKLDLMGARFAGEDSG